MMSSSNSNKKPFWHYVKSKRQDHSLLLLNHQKRQKLSMNTLNLSYIPDKGTSPYPTIPEINITLQGVNNLLSSCNLHKSPGPDNLHLKQASMEIVPTLTHLFQQSLRDNSIPAVWKQAYVTPIDIKGNRSDPKNYHPVSVTSLVCKTMEHILVSQVMKHLQLNNILIQEQHAWV